MELTDEELIRGLESRDGPILERTRTHWSTGACRYAELVGDRDCPWCEAEQRRQDAASKTDGVSPE